MPNAGSFKGLAELFDRRSRSLEGDVVDALKDSGKDFLKILRNNVRLPTQLKPFSMSEIYTEGDKKTIYVGTTLRLAQLLEYGGRMPRSKILKNNLAMWVRALNAGGLQSSIPPTFARSETVPPQRWMFKSYAQFIKARTLYKNLESKLRNKRKTSE